MSDHTSMLLDAEAERRAAMREPIACADWEDVLRRLSPRDVQCAPITGAWVRTSAGGTGRHYCVECLRGERADCEPEFQLDLRALGESNVADERGVGGLLVYGIRLRDHDLFIGGWGEDDSEQLRCANPHCGADLLEVS